MSILLRAAALGAAAGGRSVTPLAALADRGTLRVAARLAALGELVVDKLPGTPSRLAPAPLAGRVVIGALSAAIYAHRQGRSVLLPAAVAGAAAYAASYAGAGWRALAGRHGLDLPAALAEDAATVALARSAVS
ncbi:hypothetical protein ACFQS1_35390 [Paractinoplanes rhizophilus]|uniref:DUF4126 domain-containing protein n=1 Tax=Paractinoplanes rhizophilus TaxID=1416877 RepID=A0ABW2I359_9ACTN